jgi:hypothetical protein
MSGALRFNTHRVINHMTPLTNFLSPGRELAFA